MGIFDAMNTSVGGLQAQSFALQNISGNIANSSTTGYKGIGTSFVDLIPDASVPNKQVAGGVTANAKATITSQGTISSSAVATNMAITGDGFFSVQKASGVVDNVPVFDGVNYYTRRGDFQLNANGNLVNGAGYYLMGVTVDPKTGNPTGSVPTVLQFQNNFVPAQATSSIQYGANLPTQPKTVASSTAASGTLVAYGGLDPADFTSNPLPVGSPAPRTDATKTSLTGANNSLGGPITAATKLSGTAPSDSLTTGFAAGDTIIVGTSPATTITITAAGGLHDATHVPADGTVGDLLAAIGTATGVAPTINTANGAITFHTGTAQDLSIQSTASAFSASALGFTSPVNQPRGTGTVGTGTVIGSDVDTFTKESISGGAVTAYNAAGTPVNLQLRWAKTDSASLGAGHSDTWNLFYQTDPNATGTQTAWVNTGQAFTFASDGSLTSPSGSGITINNVSVSGQQLGSVAFNISSGGLTQYATTSGAVTINTITQNGYAAGQLRSVSVSNNGLVIGTFSNGQNLDLAKVTLSHFNGTNYLKAMDGGAYAVTDLSGPAIEGASGTISGSSLEGSNTDIADEFTKLIVTQQAYSANTKVITTANSMVQDLLNVLR
ncbi:flagellar hook-basal body complex protein [Bradyrhizobium sp. AS23.2]|uniref:flagellar hook protein FlgE n=1 Tax=Bradyrhizobium sp. AS23.2 TaxID=1680155 RepID=UPI0009388E1C|nr:flagellar hook-basal body complex protein [Bradyrhizobium sp. AS23.2]OKO85771.1 flagellar hook protein FlgE [Bradyrhizobium sp. AS23.2]